MSINYKRDSLFSEFLQHLKSLGVSSNTLKNYRSDIYLFSGWSAAHLKAKGIVVESLGEAIPFLSPSLASDFKHSLSGGISSQKTANRRLSALRALSRFLVQTQVLESDFMEEVANLGSPEESYKKHPLVGHFQKHLEAQNVSKNTIKNYVSDIKHFLSWLETNHQALSSTPKGVTQ